MKKLLVAALFVSSSAFAAGAKTKGGEDYLKSYDTDKDGKLSPEEIAAVPADKQEAVRKWSTDHAAAHSHTDAAATGTDAKAKAPKK